jgi:hypothetical protein
MSSYGDDVASMIHLAISGGGRKLVADGRGDGGGGDTQTLPATSSNAL